MRRWLVAMLAIMACKAPPCPECQGVLQPLVTIGDADGDGALPDYPAVSPLLPGGRYVVLVPWGAGGELPRLYDSTGAFLGTLGRHGDGPQEYRRPEFVYRVGDDAWIFDEGRVAVLSPGQDTAATAPWPLRAFTFVVLPDSTFVLTTGAVSPGPMLRHVDRAGKVLRSFGDSLPPRSREFAMALLASDDRGGLWSAPPVKRLRLQHWERPGVPGRVLALDRDWFPEYTEYLAPAPGTPPQAHLVGMWQDRDGHLWIVCRVADRDWSMGLGDLKRGEGGFTYHEIVDVNLVYDTVIEQVDQATGAPLAHYRADFAVTQVSEPWIVVSTTRDEDGWHQARLWRVPSAL